MIIVMRAQRRNAKVPLRVGDVWVYIGPATEVTITGLEPRPTFQKPHSKAVTLGDGRTIAESTLRYAYQRKEEYLAYLPVVRSKCESAKRDGETAKVLQFTRRAV